MIKAKKTYFSYGKCTQSSHYFKRTKKYKQHITVTWTWHYHKKQQ